MAKAFSLVSWNVEHFKGKPERVVRVVELLSEQNPDVFALLEVEGKTVFNDLVEQMPDYQFHITEGRQVQEALVGVKKKFTAFFTQKVAFKSGNPSLRPGALLTLVIDNERYSLLFLHTKSGSNPLGLGVRDDQFKRAFKLKRKVLDKVAGGKGKAHFLFIGDLNTMGMKYPYQKSIDNDVELRKLEKDAKKARMRRLSKTYDTTWWNGSKSRYKPADLDHVVASDHLQFKSYQGSDIHVLGWPEQKTESKQDKWIQHYSDHALLYLEVQKV